MSGRLDGRRVLVTHADRYMGPPVVELFRAEGAEVLDSTDDLTVAGDADRLVAQAGPIDVLVANFAGPRSTMPVTSMLVDPTAFTDDAFQGYLDELVWPLVRVVRAVLPQMIERRAGKIVAATSASPVRAIPGLSIYSAARGAQNAFLQVVGAEAAPHGVQVNAFGPAHIENNMYYTDEMLADPAVRESFESQIPAGRLGKGHEAAELALALATGASDFLAGQLIPISGGWAT
ncbi:SDR family NAD(P)-dependent oxidoreductase [Actinomycetospora soli]|uniref:SDR family NAD(P)-dependent oxidoreductase n=1 Tax=Actinomycetospora soli TaxID=2893887 RepID=UPI001E40BB60|nr:SDR family oxidoreductase [Actinomycetospora soli]MCD2188617.1 SDR family oxidoreductase [Actinomycetospora soli]